jgi:fructose-1,6-bisphosphatase I
MQAGTEQVAAGYVLYGPSTMLALTVGAGVVFFTLDPKLKHSYLLQRSTSFSRYSRICY